MSGNGFILDKMCADLQAQLGDKLRITADEFISWLIISPDKLLELMLPLKADYGFNYLANVTAVDYGDEFEIIYHLYSIPDNRKVGVKSRVPRTRAEVPSVMSIWPTADWQEREVFDLMGIHFNGHANLLRVLLPDDFEGHPLRKDFKREG